MKNITLPDGSTKQAERRSDSGMNGMFRPIAGVFFAIICAGFTWWLQVVWADVQDLNDDRYAIKSDVAVLKTDVKNIAEDVDEVKDGIKQLLELQLRRT